MRNQSGFSVLGFIAGIVILFGIVIVSYIAWQTISGRSGGSSGGSSLIITEWGVKLPLTSGISDAAYTVDSDGVANVTTAKLDTLLGSVHGCTSGLHGVYIQKSDQAPSFSSGWSPVHVGGSYYSPANVIQPACAVQISPETSKAIESINTELKAAASKLTGK